MKARRRTTSMIWAQMAGCYSLTLFLILTQAPLSWALRIPLGNEEDIDIVKTRVISKVDQILNEAPKERSEAQAKKMDIIFQFENEYEDYKSRLRRLSEEIIFLTEIRGNLLKIENSKRIRKKIKKDLDSRLQVFRANHADVYIPVVGVSYIKIPMKQEGRKQKILSPFILAKLINRYGLKNLAASTVVENGIVVHDYIRLDSLGAMESDGIRGFDGVPLIYRDAQHRKTQFVTVWFLRFMPFADISGMKAPALGKADNVDTQWWDLSAPQEVTELKRFVQYRFPQKADLFLAELGQYHSSLGNLQEQIDKANNRIDDVLAGIELIIAKYRRDDTFHVNNIKSLENRNRILLNQFQLSSASSSKVEAMRSKREAEKAALENGFEYKFVMMQDLPARELDTGIKQAIEQLFGRLKTVVQKKSMGITTVVMDYVLAEYREQPSERYRSMFSEADVHYYVEGDKTGVLLSLGVLYTSKSKEELKPIVADRYIEDAGGLQVVMKSVGDSLFISPEITKEQFMKFLKQNRTQISWLRPEPYCTPSVLDDYPDDFPVICISDQAKYAFALWLSQKSGRTYRIVTQKDQMAAAESGIYIDESEFRVVTEHYQIL